MTTLILLVGGNPLPNYVIARALIKRENSDIGAVYLIGTPQTGTRNIDQRLSTAIAQLGIPVTPKSVSKTQDPADLYKDIHEIVKKESIKDNIHLNYTGGRKTMAVAAYRAVSARGKSDDVYSYLDDDDHCIHYHDGTTYPDDDDLRKIIHIPLKDLLTLHGEERQVGNNVPEPNVAYRLVVDDLADVYTTDGAQGDKARKDYQTWVGTKDLDVVRQGWPENPSLKLLETHIRDVVNANPQGRNALLTFLKTDGAWLECWIYFGCSDLNAEKKLSVPITELVANYKPESSETKPFELDCITVRGYEATVFSCYKGSEREKRKIKAFEALHRAAQIGGEEARAVLVTLGNKADVDSLKLDLKNHYGLERDRLDIFGRDEVRNITKSLEKYFTATK